MYTSNFANVKRIPEGLYPVAISIGLPKWYEGRRDVRLAPTWLIVKQPRERYDEMMWSRLKKLDARKVYEELGENAVLLCYEKHNDWCHRRMVADWFEKELGVVVPELGFDRSETLPYEQCGCGAHDSNGSAEKSDPVKTESQAVQMQLPLFGLL